MTKPPFDKPVLLWDGECGFCRKWIERWKRKTGDEVKYFPYQEALDRFPQLDEDRCRQSVQLIMPAGEVYSGAHAVFKALELANRRTWLLRVYEKSALFRRLSEAAYRFVARNRSRLPNW